MYISILNSLEPNLKKKGLKDLLHHRSTRHFLSRYYFRGVHRAIFAVASRRKEG